MIADALDTKFLGVCGCVKIMSEVQGRRFSIDVFAHHGLGGGGRLEGSSINTVARLKDICIADIYIQGHDHKAWTKKSDIILQPVLNNKTGKLEIKERVSLLARSGSFLRSYMPGEASYAVDAGYKPGALGAPEIHINPMREGTRLNVEITGTA
jgi:hypothetical protein